jgi:hypothetical protein
MANSALHAEDIEEIPSWCGSGHWMADLVVSGVANRCEVGKINERRLEKFYVNGKIGEDFDEAFDELVDPEEE